jgi:hypothetical protein
MVISFQTNKTLKSDKSQDLYEICTAVDGREYPPPTTGRRCVGGERRSEGAWQWGACAAQRVAGVGGQGQARACRRTQASGGVQHADASTRAEVWACTCAGDRGFAVYKRTQAGVGGAGGRGACRRATAEAGGEDGAGRLGGLGIACGLR